MFKTKALALAALTVIGSAASTVYAQSVTSPVQLLQSHASTFTADTRDVLFAGAGLIIGALLIAKLVNLVINFFRRG